MASRFPGAPRGSYVNEDGWLIVGEEAWTEHEWATRPDKVAKGLPVGRPVTYDDPRHVRERQRLARKRAAA